MKTWKAIILLVVIGMMAVTVASAQTDDKKADDKNYTVGPLTEDSLSIANSIEPMLATYYITQGQSRNHYSPVGIGTLWLEYNLYWGNTANSLTLTIYTPSGANIGTFHDNSDGVVDGRIHLGIWPSSGYIDSGVWTSKVYGESVSGTQSYTINVVGHLA